MAGDVAEPKLVVTVGGIGADREVLSVILMFRRN